MIRNEDKNFGLGMITSNRDKSTILSLDLGNTLLELFIISKVRLQPGKSIRLEDYLVLGNTDVEAMKKLATTLRSVA